MKKTILFVDDEDVNLFVLSRRFEDDFNVLTCNSALQALSLIEEEKDAIHALISDVKMPEMTGLQLIEKAKKILKDVPCFLLTGYDNHESIERAIKENQVVQIFKKPFNYNEILDTLKSHIH